MGTVTFSKDMSLTDLARLAIQDGNGIVDYTALDHADMVRVTRGSDNANAIIGFEFDEDGEVDGWTVTYVDENGGAVSSDGGNGDRHQGLNEILEAITNWATA